MKEKLKSIWGQTKKVLKFAGATILTVVSVAAGVIAQKIIGDSMKELTKIVIMTGKQVFLSVVNRGFSVA